MQQYKVPEEDYYQEVMKFGNNLTSLFSLVEPFLNGEYYNKYRLTVSEFQTWKQNNMRFGENCK